jgi:hypothetical protein
MDTAPPRTFSERGRVALPLRGRLCANGEGYLRLSYTNSVENITKALERMRPPWPLADASDARVGPPAPDRFPNDNTPTQPRLRGCSFSRRGARPARSRPHDPGGESGADQDPPGRLTAVARARPQGVRKNVATVGRLTCRSPGAHTPRTMAAVQPRQVSGITLRARPLQPTLPAARQQPACWAPDQALEVSRPPSHRQPTCAARQNLADADATLLDVLQSLALRRGPRARRPCRIWNSPIAMPPRYCPMIVLRAG